MARKHMAQLVLQFNKKAIILLINTIFTVKAQGLQP